MTITIGKRWVAFGAIIAVLVVAWSLSMASAQTVTVTTNTTDGLAGCGTTIDAGATERCAVQFNVSNTTASTAKVYLEVSPYLGNSILSDGFMGLSRCNTGEDCEKDVLPSTTGTYTVFVKVSPFSAARLQEKQSIKVRHKVGSGRADSDPTLHTWEITATNNAYVAPAATPTPTPTPVLTAPHPTIYTPTYAQQDVWLNNWGTSGEAAHDAFWDGFDAKIVANGDAPYQICHHAQKNVTIYGWKFRPNFDKTNWGGDFDNLTGLTGADGEVQAVVDYDAECFQVNDY